MIRSVIPEEFFHPGRSLELNMVNEKKMLSVVCFCKQNTVPIYNVYQTNSVAFSYGLQTPLSITILRSRKTDIGYPFMLAAVINCHKSN